MSFYFIILTDLISKNCSIFLLEIWLGDLGS
jgi:hypothetical protein